MADHPEVPDAVLARLRLVCLDLPEAYEEAAWVGIPGRFAGPRVNRSAPRHAHHRRLGERRWKEQNGPGFGPSR
jgi:hypothetical protein